MGKKLVLDTGLKTYDVEDKEGNFLFSISFNPADTNIVHRYNEVVESLEKISNEVPGVEEDLKAGLDYLDELVYEKVNYLLNADVSKQFFSVMGPFTPMENGNYYLESVLDAVAKVIQIEIGERVKKINSKVKKHTSKYHG